jgi:hypothetical protein
MQEMSEMCSESEVYALFPYERDLLHLTSAMFDRDCNFIGTIIHRNASTLPTSHSWIELKISKACSVSIVRLCVLSNTSGI